MQSTQWYLWSWSKHSQPHPIPCQTHAITRLSSQLLSSSPMQNGVFHSPSVVLESLIKSTLSSSFTNPPNNCNHPIRRLLTGKEEHQQPLSLPFYNLSNADGASPKLRVNSLHLLSICHLRLSWQQTHTQAWGRCYTQSVPAGTLLQRE